MFAIFPIVMLMADSAAAEPKVSEIFDYYDVSGSTVQELRADLNRHRPASVPLQACPRPSMSPSRFHV